MDLSIRITEDNSLKKEKTKKHTKNDKDTIKITDTRDYKE
jgi:hypothetical protein